MSYVLKSIRSGQSGPFSQVAARMSDSVSEVDDAECTKVFLSPVRFYTGNRSASVRFAATPATARALNPCNYILSSIGWLKYLK